MTFSTSATRRTTYLSSRRELAGSSDTAKVDPTVLGTSIASSSTRSSDESVSTRRIQNLFKPAFVVRKSPDRKVRAFHCIPPRRRVPKRSLPLRDGKSDGSRMHHASARALYSDRVISAPCSSIYRDCHGRGS